MDSFLNSCILISRFDSKDNYHEVCSIFLDNDDNKLISLYQDQVEIPNLFSRKKKLINQALLFFDNRKHTPDFKDLTDKERLLLKNLILSILSGKTSKEDLNHKVKEIISLEKKVLSFIQKKISKKVIPLCDIKEDLVNVVKNFNHNSADAKVIASAILEHQNNKLIAFTLDKKDWKINTIRHRIEDMGYACPEVRFLR
jgi:hypothetical protein